MKNNHHYKIEYLSDFNNELREILKYIKNKLYNANAANNLLKEIERAIDKIQKFPRIHETYMSVKKGKQTWYKVKVKNYIILYTIYGNNVTISHIIYGRRDIQKIINYYTNKTNFNY